ncbi:MAG: hypothetical protein VKK62_07535 [Synechococcaceae cyanobacterium]|nr:hypothetical protein [Synechococcaceae cyanobacterium]
MPRIRQRRERHFIDEAGRLFWINGPEDHCYLSEQRQWRQGLDFDQVLEWKQCAPSGLVSQRFPSLQAACEAFCHGQISWYQDLYLRRMGDQMAAHRSADDYKPTAMKRAEAAGAPQRQQPWRLPEPLGPVCSLPPRPCERALADVAGGDGGHPHPHRRRRSTRQLTEQQPALLPRGDAAHQLR